MTPTPSAPVSDGEREQATLTQLLASARNYKMTPADREMQRRSFARSNSGLTDEQLRQQMPELFEVGDLTARTTQAEAERDRALAEVARLRGQLRVLAEWRLPSNRVSIASAMRQIARAALAAISKPEDRT